MVLTTQQKLDLALLMLGGSFRLLVGIMVRPLGAGAAVFKQFRNMLVRPLSDDEKEFVAEVLPDPIELVNVVAWDAAVIASAPRYGLAPGTPGHTPKRNPNPSPVKTIIEAMEGECMNVPPNERMGVKNAANGYINTTETILVGANRKRGRPVSARLNAEDMAMYEMGQLLKAQKKAKRNPAFQGREEHNGRFR